MQSLYICTHVLVDAKAIIHGFAIVNKNLYGFFLVKAKYIPDCTISCCTNIPTVMAAINIPNWENILSTFSMLAIDTAIRLITPTGVVLLKQKKKQSSSGPNN